MDGHHARGQPRLQPRLLLCFCQRRRLSRHLGRRQLAAAERVVGARAQRFRDVAAKSKERVDKEQQYYLYKSPLRYVPMTAAQRTRINAAIGARGGYAANAGDAWRRFLSPRQVVWLQQVEASPQKEWPVAQGVSMARAIVALERAAK